MPEKILIVENDPFNGDLISRQALKPLGYKTLVVENPASAIQEVIRFSPDVVLTRLNFPELSGKDFLAALSSQKIDIPVIVMAEKGMENDVIQAFRLGAYDYLRYPIRDTEVVASVERALKNVRGRKDRHILAGQLQQTNEELERRVRELTAIYSIGKAVTSITNQRDLFNKIIEAAITVIEADSSCFLLRDEKSKSFLLVAYNNLPGNMIDRLNQPWDDGLSNLVAMSGETLAIEGEALDRFRISSLGRAVLVVPVKIKKEVIGLIIVIRKKHLPFGASDKNLLEAAADYASISLVNARLFNALEERAKYLQQVAETNSSGELAEQEFLQTLGRDLLSPLEVSKSYIDMLMAGEAGKLYSKQTDALQIISEKIHFMLPLVEQAISSFHRTFKPKRQISLNLNDKVRQSISRYRRIAQQSGLTITPILPERPVLAYADSIQVDQILDGLLVNALKYCYKDGNITITVEEMPDKRAHVAVENSGKGVDPELMSRLFEPGFHDPAVVPFRFSAPGIDLSEMHEIISAHGGSIWAETEPEQRFVIHFFLFPPEMEFSDETPTLSVSKKDLDFPVNNT